MKKFLILLALVALSVTIFSCSKADDGYRTISLEVLKDKISGGWAGKMIGVS